MKKVMFIILAMFALASCSSGVKDNVIAEVEVKNTSDFDRSIETIEIAVADLKGEKFSTDSLVVIAAESGLEIPSQVIKDESGKAKTLIFQHQSLKNSAASFKVLSKTPQSYASKTDGAVISSRFNDFAWENDIIAFRVYNEKLIPVDGPSGGVDIWSKRTNDLIVRKWYKEGHYHTDHGEGCDHYKVGPSLGAGGLGFIVDDKLVQHSNYIDAKIIANGPIRFQAILTFPKIDLGGKEIAMTKTLTIDAGQNLNQFTIDFSEPCEKVALATGIVLRKEEGDIYKADDNTYVSYWQPEHKKHGFTGVGVVNLSGKIIKEIDNHIVIGSKFEDKSFTYFSGACWSKASSTASALVSPNNKSDWENYLSTYSQQLKNPLEVTVTLK